MAKWQTSLQLQKLHKVEHSKVQPQLKAQGPSEKCGQQRPDGLRESEAREYCCPLAQNLVSPNPNDNLVKDWFGRSVQGDMKIPSGADMPAKESFNSVGRISDTSFRHHPLRERG